MGVSMDDNGVPSIHGFSSCSPGFPPWLFGGTQSGIQGTNPRDTTGRQNLVASQGHGEGEGHVETILLNQTAEVLTKSRHLKTPYFYEPDKWRKAARYATESGYVH